MATLKKRENALKRDLKELGLYRKEFDRTIKRYCQLTADYEDLYAEWEANGKPIIEQYTNKNGATNNRKCAIYQAKETLEKQLLELENTLGLTPKGYKNISTQESIAPLPPIQSPLEQLVQSLNE